MVVRSRQVRDDAAALIVGNNDLGILGWQLARLRDYPGAGFRPVRTGDHPADVVLVDLDRRLLRSGWSWRGNCQKPL